VRGDLELSVGSYYRIPQLFDDFSIPSTFLGSYIGLSLIECLEYSLSSLCVYVAYEFVDLYSLDLIEYLEYSLLSM